MHKSDGEHACMHGTTYLCALSSSPAFSRPLLPLRFAANLNDFCFFECCAVGGPGAFVFPSGTRCTASPHGMRGLSEDGKSLILLYLPLALSLLELRAS